MRFFASLAMASVAVTSALAQESYDLLVNGEPWLSTSTPEYQPRGKDREETYKVFTHLYDFNGENLLTKGSGGLYTHHRGLFIGWMKTAFGDETVDTWHMRGCYQTHVEWLEQRNGETESFQSERIEWRTADDIPFIRETRNIIASQGESGLRIIDFQSTLEAVSQPIQLRGDLQHAGMQIRLANEVSEHEETTSYILPESAVTQENDEVINAWWATCTAEIAGKRYWFTHMTPPDHPTGAPVYSIRAYARFGAFSEHDLEPGTPLELNFRIVASEKELDQAASRALYDVYAAGRSANE